MLPSKSGGSMGGRLAVLWLMKRQSVLFLHTVAEVIDVWGSRCKRKNGAQMSSDTHSQPD